MKKILLLICGVTTACISFGLDCTPTHRAYETAQKNIFELSQKPHFSQKEYDKSLSLVARTGQEMENCENELMEIFQQGYIDFQSGNYLQSIQEFERYLSGNQDISGENYTRAIGNLQSAYIEYAHAFFRDKKWSEAAKYYEKTLTIDDAEYDIQYSLGSAYYNQGIYDRAVAAYERSLELSQTQGEKISSKKSIKQAQYTLSKNSLSKNIPATTSITNDTFGGLQYSLEMIHAKEAWSQITEPKKVIIAVIDNGVDVSHPDLQNSLWHPSTNTVNDTIKNNTPLGEHGTMVAGIIGAESGNKIGISGIAKNTEIMPLQVFEKDGLARENTIIDAINYAVNNGANIINISIGESQFRYSERFDDVIKRAYDEGVVVVIAGGNGNTDINEGQGVDTTTHPISPVCNNGKQRKYAIGVGSVDINGERSGWSNYGTCVPIYAPGENIVSTSIKNFNTGYQKEYNILSGTSFATPIVSGIIALGYNKYGYISPDIVQKTLLKSTWKNEQGEKIVDADKYLKNLDKKKRTIEKIQAKRIKKIQEREKIKTLSDKDALIKYRIIDDPDTLGEYPTIQEVVTVGLRLGKIQIPKNYICKGYFSETVKDCATGEIAVDHGIISREDWSQGDRHISEVLSLSLLLTSAGIWSTQDESTTQKTKRIAEYYGIIKNQDDIRTDKIVSKAELFARAKKILEQKI